MKMTLLWTGAVLLALPCLAAQPESHADADGATDSATALVAGLKRPPPAKTAYTEVRFSGLLDRPLILHGELEYLGPGELGKRVDTPYKEQTTIRNGEAEVQRGSHPPRTFSVSRSPELEGFLRGFSALLGGDAKALTRDFKLASDGNAANWQLTLTPRDTRLARRVKSIEVFGSAHTPRCFRTNEADGDISVLLVDTLATTHLTTRPSPALLDGLCRGRSPD